MLRQDAPVKIHHILLTRFPWCSCHCVHLKVSRGHDPALRVGWPTRLLRSVILFNWQVWLCSQTLSSRYGYEHPALHCVHLKVSRLTRLSGSVAPQCEQVWLVCRAGTGMNTRPCHRHLYSNLLLSLSPRTDSPY